MPDSTRWFRWATRLKGIALSAFVKQGSKKPATKGVESCHLFAFALFATVALVQLAPRAPFVLLPSKQLLILESAAFAALDAALIALCAFWFWLYFADRSAEPIRVRPMFIGGQQIVELAVPDLHSSQLILLILPLMLAFLISLVSLLFAQIGFLAALLGTENPVAALQGAASIQIQSECAGFGDSSHRAFLAIFASTLGNDHACFKLTTSGPIGAYLVLSLWLVRGLLATVAFGVFVQFGTVIVRRKR